jgi:hypothetical protein
MNRSVIRKILKVTERPCIISFAAGLPSARTFPKTDLCSKRSAVKVRTGRSQPWAGNSSQSFKLEVRSCNPIGSTAS